MNASDFTKVPGKSFSICNCKRWTLALVPSAMLHIYKYNNALLHFPPTFMPFPVTPGVFVQLLSLPSLVWDRTAVWQLHKLSFPTSRARFPSAQFDLPPQHTPLGEIELLLSGLPEHTFPFVHVIICKNSHPPSAEVKQSSWSRQILFQWLFSFLTNPANYDFVHEESAQHACIPNVAALLFVLIIWPQ